MTLLSVFERVPVWILFCNRLPFIFSDYETTVQSLIFGGHLWSLKKCTIF